MNNSSLRKRASIIKKTLILIVLFSGLQTNLFATEVDPYADVNASWDRFGAVYLHILENYYTHLDQNKVMQAAIDGMVKELDAYSQYYDEEGLRQLRQDTTGKFAGLGITVGIKDQYPVVIAPIEDTPAERAGLLPGDLLIEIEGKSTQKKPLDEIVNMLRGEPGSSVNLKIEREGKQGWDTTLQRQIIKIKSVNLTEILDSNIGYISMRQTRFSEDTGSEVGASLKKLKEQRVKGVILDLRGNPGGLLSQAVEVAELVLPKGASIVTVKERDAQKEEKKNARGQAVSELLPLVVLIDEGSASASEIVAGAIQDNDRGVILGTTSFGKGSVQTIFDLQEAENSALKLTTALYYTPSGRSIHREGHQAERNLLIKVPFGEVELPAPAVLDIILNAADPMQAAAELKTRFDIEESITAQILATPLGDLVGHSAKTRNEINKDDSLNKAEKQVYYTKKGRKVYGGGGINPDVYVEQKPMPTIVKELERDRMFFDFAVEYVGKDSLLANSVEVPEVDASMVAEFEVFVKKKSSLSDTEHYESVGISKIKNLRSLGTEMKWGQRVMVAIDSLESALREEGGKGVVNTDTEATIKEAIRRELTLRLKGKKASMLFELAGDEQVKKAVDLLKTPQRYNQLLIPSGS